MNMKSKSGSVNKSKSNESAKDEDGLGTMESASANNDCPREQMIAEAAYFLAERRGFAPENDIADWLQAENDVTATIDSGQYRAGGQRLPG
jgi:hypothetical protein